ncbi:glycosyltransferase [Sphingosinicella rhizophila]|uniref:Glycosyltransferase n=1 Tax=Sphingosinicella rhizophila TaxID=3050082 RepID=A0ABU3Q9L3_9SPHN|nr:glycosyltransferase [Sphingosinicella sp. GR2756]MDT9599635.1 glycosyltransferase [Sphingosinicella sp. GR2756]
MARRGRGISVVITCHNLERFIGEAIESVLAQDFGEPVQIVVVDDCSTDGSAGIIAGYGGVSHVRTDRNGGVLLATIAGIEAAEGELIFFLDGDDLWEPGKLSACVPRFREDQRLAFLTHDLLYIDEQGRALDRTTRPGDEFAGLAPDVAGERVREGILTLGDFVWLGSAFGIHRLRARIEEFCAWARQLPDPANTYQDWPLAYWVAARSDVTLGHVPQKLFRYRLHGANFSGDATSVAKASRNLRRTRNTSAAMAAIARDRGLAPHLRMRAERQTRFYDYLLSLYAGARARAGLGFAGSFPYLIARPALFAKELVRFAGVQLLGAEAFIRLSKRGLS